MQRGARRRAEPRPATDAARSSRRRSASPSSATTTSSCPTTRSRACASATSPSSPRRLDYGGLQREAVALLERDDDTRRTYQSAFRYVLVDEYQDTNVAQERLLELLAGEHRNVFCVADEDQSIYGFRGAEIDNTLRFDERWPGASRYDLPINYRSAPTIVELATSVIRRNVDTHLGKALRAAEEREARLVGRTFRHAAEEADWIAREIAGLRLDGVAARTDRRPRPLAAGRSARALAYALRRHAIPFHAPLAPQLHPSADALLSLLELAAAYPWEPAHDDAGAARARLPALRRRPAGAAPLPPQQPRTLYGALRESGDFERVLRGAGDRQAPATRRRRDLRPLGAARALPRRSQSSGTRRASRSRSSRP